MRWFFCSIDPIDSEDLRAKILLVLVKNVIGFFVPQCFCMWLARVKVLSNMHFSFLTPNFSAIFLLLNFTKKFCTKILFLLRIYAGWKIQTVYI